MSVHISIGMLVVLGISGCVPGSPGVPDELAWVLEEREAISVTPVLDESLAAVSSMTITEGGIVSATGADGTTYTLMVPPDALRSDVIITMTPLASIEGLPFGDGTALAVQLEPSGLQLDAFASLDIVSAAAPSPSEQILFGYQGAGEDLSLALPDRATDGIRILLDHFSGYGVGNGLLTDLGPIRQRLGGTAEARITSALGEALQVEKQGGAKADLGQYFQLFEDQVLKPRIAAAGSSCGNATIAIQTAADYDRQRQLAGLEPSSFDFRSLFTTVGSICLKEEYDLCKVNHIVHRMVPFWLLLDRQRQLLNIEDAAALAVVAEAAKKVEDCLTFSVEFESDVVGVEEADEVQIATAVTATTEFSYDTQAKKFTSETVPLTNTSVTFTLSECDFAETTGDGTFAIENMILRPSEFDLSPPGDGSSPKVGEIESIELRLTLGRTSESTVETCFGSSVQIPPFAWWTELATDASGPSLTNITDWQIPGNAVFATSQWSRTGPLGSTDTGNAVLNHIPR